MKRWLPWLAVALCLTVAYALGRRASRLSAEATQWRQQAESALAAIPAYREAIERYHRLERQHRLVATQSQRELDRLRTRLAQIRTDTVTQVDTVELIAVQDSLVSTCQARALSLEAGWAACTIRADRAVARADSLTVLVQRGLEVRECNLLGVSWLPKCLSRRTSFIVGGIVGAGLVAIVRR